MNDQPKRRGWYALPLLLAAMFGVSMAAFAAVQTFTEGVLGAGTVTVDACSTPVAVGWTLNGSDQVTELVLSSVPADCQSVSYSYSIEDSVPAVIDSGTGTTAAAATTTITLGSALDPADVVSVDLIFSS